MPQKQTTKHACVIGWPIAHSLSPKMHGHWLTQYGIDGSYTASAVTPGELKDALQKLIDEGYAGCNLTTPHKEEALSLMDAHDESSLAAGAVNTVVIKDGRMKGYDSDGFGFIENLKAQLPSWNGERIVVVGTGGAARSIIKVLQGAGAKKFILVNRTQDRAEKIAEAFDLDAEIFSWDQRNAALANASLLVNGSCLGMVGQPPLELDLSLLPTTAGVCDIVYRPLMTPLLAAARERGNPVVEGIGMLIHQGRLGFRNWFGKDPEVTQSFYEEMKKAAK
jgi:shikimate dehydrogenase